MGDFRVDKEAFKSRMKKLYAAWKDAAEDDPLSRSDALVVAVGTADVVYCKSISVQTWLFGYELPDTIMAFCQSSIVVLSSKKKVNFVQQVEGVSKDGSIPPFKFLIRDKNDKDKENLQALVEAIKSSSGGKTIGVFSKDKFPGEFMDAWNEAAKGAGFEKVDVNVPIGYVMASKDESEITLIRKACNATMELYNKYVREQLVDIIDKEKQVKHSKLAAQIEQAAQNGKYSSGLDSSHLDTCYQPIIQSGGKYELKFSAKVGENTLHFGAIVCMLGLRYRSYCSNIARTLMVGPTAEMQNNYKTLLKGQEAAITALRHGVKLSEVYEASVKVIQSEKPELVDKLTKNAGFGMGLEFRETSLAMSPKSDVVATKGMVFNLNLGLSDLLNKDAKDEEGKIYSLFIGDTVLVNDENTPASVLTPQKRQSKHAFIFLKEDEEDEKEEVEEEEEEEEEKSQRGRGQRGGAVVPKRTEMTAEEKRHVHQKKIAERLHQEALQRNAGFKEKEDEKKNRKVNISYKNESSMPTDTEMLNLQVFVDKKHETVCLPFNGTQLPFHIATIKNISQSVEGDQVCLRINFFHAGSNIGRNEALIYPMADEKFLKDLVLKGSNSEPGEISSNSSNLRRAYDSIKEVQKKFKSREAEEREKEGVMKQDSLIISPSAGNPKLNNVYIRPNILSKRISGVLEAHTNGLRFTSVRKDRVDILYNNIKTAFFQPCDSELVILVHFHLKNAILFGKKKHVDVQFYTEVGEIITDLGKHQYSHDRDDLRAEQAERELRNKLKETFNAFCTKVSTKGDFKFESPLRELGFNGAPNRSTVFIQPTDGCLVNLTEWPPFVVTLKEVEIVHFERVQFQLKNFDMVFVFKDYHKKVAMITAIPMTTLDQVKEWLNTCDIKYSEGIQSLNWTKIMKTIADDPAKFFDDGGWKFLDPESEDENDDDDDDEEDDEYSPSDSGSEEYSSEGGSDDSNWSAEEDEDSEEELGSSEESGKDWDELEEEAKRADADIYEEEDNSRNHKPSSKLHKHRSPEKKKHRSPEKKKHRSPEKKKHRSPEKKKHRSPEKKKHRSPEKKHKSPHKDHKHKNGHASRDEKSSKKRKHDKR